MGKPSIASYLTDNLGRKSSMRLVVVLGGGLFLLCLCAAWTYVSIQKVELAQIPSGVIFLLTTLLGLKTVQSGIEISRELFSKKGNGEDRPRSSASDPPQAREPGG